MCERWYYLVMSFFQLVFAWQNCFCFYWNSPQAYVLYSGYQIIDSTCDIHKRFKNPPHTHHHRAIVDRMILVEGHWEKRRVITSQWYQTCWRNIKSTLLTVKISFSLVKWMFAEEFLQQNDIFLPMNSNTWREFHIHGLLLGAVVETK